MYHRYVRCNFNKVSPCSEFYTVNMKVSLLLIDMYVYKSGPFLFQVITFVHTLLTHKQLKLKTCLVVCPLNTVLNWSHEWEKWLDKKDRLPVCKDTNPKYCVVFFSKHDINILPQEI